MTVTLLRAPDVTAAHAANARLVRRLVLAPTPELVESFAGATPGEIVDDLLARPGLDGSDGPIDDEDWEPCIRWWIDTMLRDDALLHERLVWCWHGILTSSREKANGPDMVVQNQLLRRHATGDFRSLMREITTDPAMLAWLDGSRSHRDAPNENYARELMELFTLGRDSDAYDEADVRAAAYALSGWFVDDGKSAPATAEFDSEAGPTRSVRLLGQWVRGVDEVIDVVTGHEACPRHVATRVAEHFVADADLDAELVTRLADRFRDADLRIGPMLDELLHDDAVLHPTAQRSRSGLEWYLALVRLVGADRSDDWDVWPLDQLGQMPMVPPNVAGWPGESRWTSAGAILTKGQMALNGSWDADTLSDTDPVGDVLRRAVLYEVDPVTRRALDRLAREVEGRRDRSTVLHAAVAMSPEFSLT